VATPSRLREHGQVQILDNTGEVLNRVDRAAFFQRFQDAEAVQYFYEPFLQAFDPALRKELGVWYTPREVVQYMVARVDAVLREELGIARGLADEQVVVLDPCCGTGAYLVEVLHRIAETLRQEGGDALLASDLRKAAQERVFGFELLPAPFVVSHLQLGLLLQRLGAPLRQQDRAGVFLTNALTGWTVDREAHLPFPELEAERERAEEVKRQRKVLVILGNPPYNGFAGITESTEERDLTQAYRVVKKVAKPKGQGLNDLYVRFYRMAERKIVEGTGRGIVCFISNYSWLDGLSFTGMREQFLDKFDRIWIDNLNGDKYKTGKLTPEGEPDPSIFSTPEEPVGIQVGTVIALLLRREGSTPPARVAYRDLWGAEKSGALVHGARATSHELGRQYATLKPDSTIGLPFLEAAVAGGYSTWGQLISLVPRFFPGVQSKRDALVVDIDRNVLVRRMRSYFDPGVTDAEMERICADAVRTDNPDFDLSVTRARLQERGMRDEYIGQFAFRPFDVRWIYWEPDGGLLGRRSPELFRNVFPGNVLLASQQRPRGEWDPPQVVSVLGCLDIMDRSASFFPLYLREDAIAGSIFEGAPPGTKANLSDLARQYLKTMGAAREIALFSHIIATLHTPKYREENAGALRHDWPRIPLPRDHATLDRSVVLGWELRCLLDPEVEVPAGTASGYGVNFRDLGVLTTADRGQLDPRAGDLALTAGWGHGGNGRPTMPGPGKVVDHGSHLDIYLNDRAWWANVPKAVWEYTLGGYQVIKKWLSYREKAVLGRDLTVEEARYVTEMVRRIAAILALGPALDENYEAVKRDTYVWGGS
jgi:predicted helicase